MNRRTRTRNAPRCLAGALWLGVMLAPSPLSSAERTPQEAEEVARRVLECAIVIDTHADTPQMILDQDYDLADPQSPYMVSIPKMQQGRVAAEFFSIWVPVDWPAGGLIRRALDLIDAVSDQVERHSERLTLASTAEEIVRAHEQRKIAILMGLEGGHAIEKDLRVLDVYYRLGVRYMTLTHTRTTGWAGSSGDKAPSQGLTDFGLEVVERMNRLGMMVDISHVSDQTFFDVLEATRAPVIASHSSCRAICDQPRNMSDPMIRALAKNDGVININFYSTFLDPEYARSQSAISKREDAAVAAARRKLARARRRLTYAEETKIRMRFEPQLPTPSFERIADHIDHAVRIGGVAHVGLGSDFDGVDSIPRGMEDASKLPALVRELVRRGYKEEDLIKILGGNMLRVMREVESVARQLQSGEENR